MVSAFSGMCWFAIRWGLNSRCNWHATSDAKQNRKRNQIALFVELLNTFMAESSSMTAPRADTIQRSQASDRKRRPVFVIGCHRSGTKLLYDTLLAAGGFALYRGYLPVYEILLPHFGSPEHDGSRSRMIRAFLQSKGFRRAGVDGDAISS